VVAPDAPGISFQPTDAFSVEILDFRTRQSGHVWLHRISNADLQIGKVAIADGKTYQPIAIQLE
jgi:hypothetical protein